jgi:hypothetical protein
VALWPPFFLTGKFVHLRTETIFDDRGRATSAKTGIIQVEDALGKVLLMDASQSRTTSSITDGLGTTNRTNNIKQSARRHNMPAELLASVLVAELLDYNILDTMFDDLTLIGAEKHSLGIAQIRIDTARLQHLDGWDDNTLAYLIRNALLDPKHAVDLLAQSLRYVYDQATVATQGVYSIENWNGLTYEQKEQRVEGFAGSKDSGSLNGQGSLAALGKKAFRIVREFRRYDD